MPPKEPYNFLTGLCEVYSAGAAALELPFFAIASFSACRRADVRIFSFCSSLNFVADVFRYPEGFHLIGGEWAQLFERRLMGWFAIELAVEVAGVQDDRYAVVEPGHQFVRGGDDGVALKPPSVRGV